MCLVFFRCVSAVCRMMSVICWIVLSAWVMLVLECCSVFVHCWIFGLQCFERFFANCCFWDCVRPLVRMRCLVWLFCIHVLFFGGLSMYMVVKRALCLVAMGRRCVWEVFPALCWVGVFTYILSILDLHTPAGVFV